MFLTFDDEAEKTRDTARVRPWIAVVIQAHEQMDFNQGWGPCADHLEALVARP